MIGRVVGSMAQDNVFCTIEYMSSGLLVKYAEVEKRRVRVPKASLGIDMGFMKKAMDVLSSGLGLDEDWQGDEKKEKFHKMRDVLGSLEPSGSQEFEEKWFSAEKAIFCSKIEEVPAAVTKAYEAYLGILKIQREGDTIIPEGGLPGMGLYV